MFQYIATIQEHYNGATEVVSMHEFSFAHAFNRIQAICIGKAVMNVAFWRVIKLEEIGSND